ncbi:MAG: hypothetical protein DWH97_01485 [Planctomycetota bacterium]|nr:MAG: hypothetical protein DWH97_01485 [Planctomycetota bacterium]RLS96761.1 MAG: hypothetical protein DWI12_01655 [Planctomycetota bacterium]
MRAGSATNERNRIGDCAIDAGSLTRTPRTRVGAFAGFSARKLRMRMPPVAGTVHGCSGANDARSSSSRSIGAAAMSPSKARNADSRVANASSNTVRVARSSVRS